MRQARRAWNLLHIDSARARAMADRAAAAARRDGDAASEGWALLVRGFHLLYFGTAPEASRVLREAERCLKSVDDRAAIILAAVGQARARWRQGQFRAALEQVLPLRDEGVRVLRHEQRGVLLNTIAGCYSALGASEQAFAYMFEALRDAGPRRGRGFDTVLHCNLSHELQQVGDFEQALRHVDEGLNRCRDLDNARLQSVLRINRITCLTELGRAGEALADVQAVLSLPADESGRGLMEPAYECMAIAALRGGDLQLGASLVRRPRPDGVVLTPDEALEGSCAEILLAVAEQRPDDAARRVEDGWDLAAGGQVDGLSVRVRATFFGIASEALERAGRPDRALAASRLAQQLQRELAQRASQARYQAAALQTELLGLQQRLDAKDAQRRATERARAELAAINEQLSRKVAEVQALQEALRQQATQDALTGLFNRRHLNEALPQLVALSRRDAQPLALAIIDLDHFKEVNDRLGHAAGDRLLAAFGELLSAQCRRSDIACRYGGEEFCLLLPRTDAAGARRKLQSLLRRWRSQRFAFDGRKVEGLSFSAGAADTQSGSGSPDDLLRRADAALLEAKREGRARVLLASPAED